MFILFNFATAKAASLKFMMLACNGVLVVLKANV
jgi:hypothetical protein